MRKRNLIIIMLIFMLLMPLRSYALGGGRGGFGGRSGFSGQRFGGHRFGGHGFGHGGFHHGGYGYGQHGNFGHSGHGHHHHGHSSTDFFLGFGFGALALSPFVLYPYYAYPYYTYPYYNYPYAYSPSGDQSYGDLEINVTPEHVEIYVDGRFLGLAGDFKGPAIAAVPSGSHVVEFRYNGASSSNNVYVAPGSKSAVSGEFIPTPGSAKEY